MKIDSSRYTSFWSNPERFRLREFWRLAPKTPTPGTFADLLTYGRKRGTCYHELLDAAHRGVDRFQAVEELKAGGFGQKEIDAAIHMAEYTEERYTDLEVLAHEVLFTYDIPDSPHSLVGRIDHIIKWDDRVVVGDYKTTKRRTKKELSYKAQEYCNSVQVPFYLIGARTLGFTTNDFLYRLVVDDDPVEIQEHWTRRTGLQLKEFARSVHQTCELILWMKNTFGLERPWPQLPERFSTGYESIAGSRQYEGAIPDGFEFKQEHLPIAEIA